jgi:hypothetical protein
MRDALSLFLSSVYLWQPISRYLLSILGAEEGSQIPDGMAGVRGVGQSGECSRFTCALSLMHCAPSSCVDISERGGETVLDTGDSHTFA